MQFPSTDNPFFGQPGVRWEIYALGLRNPYRFKVHPQTGDLYIGVVGPDARYDYDEDSDVRSSWSNAVDSISASEVNAAR